MALSCYSSNWGELEHLNSDVNIFAEPQAEYFYDILGLNHNPLTFSDPYIDPILSSHDLFYSENYMNNCPYSLDPKNEYEPQYSSTKRQKGYEGFYNIDNSSSEVNDGVLSSLCNNGFVPNPPSLLSSEILSPFGSSFSSNNPPVFSSGSGGGGGDEMTNVKKVGSGSGSSSSTGGGGGGTLSSQSIAARERRRKITEKTQVLGKLIPGGQKMNTAEMFQAAFKYIKFLQAQVGILTEMHPVDDHHQETAEDSFDNQELNPLLGSFLIQEKLYSMEKCLVPTKFVQSIAIVNDHNSLQSNNHQALKDFKELIGGDH